MNAVRNAIWLGMLFIFVFIFGFMWYIMPQMYDRIYAATNAAAPSETLDTTYINLVSFKSLIIQGFYILASILVFFTLLSSIVEAQSVWGYLISAFAGLVVTPSIIYIITTFWNTYAVIGITFDEISMVFVNSFGTIMLINFLAGLMAFIFMKRGSVMR